MRRSDPRRAYRDARRSGAISRRFHRPQLVNVRRIYVHDANQDLTLQVLLDRLRSVVGRWHQGTRQGNDGNHGNTLEDLLGVPENNLSIPDFGDFEIKTYKEESGSLITLFHKEPNPPVSVPRLLLSLGWRHRLAGTQKTFNELSFRSTTPSSRFTNRGFTVSLTDDRVEFIFDPSQIVVMRDLQGISEFRQQNRRGSSFVP
jgi:hypothetical protein